MYSEAALIHFCLVGIELIGSHVKACGIRGCLEVRWKPVELKVTNTLWEKATIGALAIPQMNNGLHYHVTFDLGYI